MLVTVIGVPKLLLDANEEIDVPDEGLPNEVENVEAMLIMEGLDKCTHPCGEHSNAVGQHPPPVSGEHSTVDAMHFGGLAFVALHLKSVAVELQQ